MLIILCILLAVCIVIIIKQHIIISRCKYYRNRNDARIKHYTAHIEQQVRRILDVLEDKE